MGAPRGLGRPNCSGFPSPADPSLPGQTPSKLLGAQNRPQEVPKGDKKRYRKKNIENRRQEDHQERKKELQKALTVFDPTTGRVQGEQFGRPRPLGAPLFARLD